MEDMKKLSESELENVSGGGIPEPKPLTLKKYTIWECGRCHYQRECPEEDYDFWASHNVCTTCGGSCSPAGIVLR